MFWDWFHIRHLGLDRDLLGSTLVLWLRSKSMLRMLLAHGIPREQLRTDDSILSHVWQICRSKAHLHGFKLCKTNPMTVNSFGLRDTSKPEIALPSWVKAEQMKILMWCMALLASEVADFSPSADPGVSRCLECAQLCMRSLSQSDTLLTKCGLWVIRTRMSPLAVSTLPCESFLGFLKPFSRKCHANVVSAAILNRYKHYMAMRFDQLRRSRISFKRSPSQILKVVQLKLKRR